MLAKKAKILWLSLVIFLFACTQPAAPTDVIPTGTIPLPAQTQTQTAVQIQTQTAVDPTVQPTEIPARTLVICLGQEPQTLYIYGASSYAMWNVLEAIYDGPIDMRDFSPQPVILEKLPSLADGSAVIAAVDVQPGEVVIDAAGNLAALQDGVLILPSGCMDKDCAVAWNTESPVQMDQLSVQFKLLPGITWSDGAPLTAEDSVYSYQVSADPNTPVSRNLLMRTAEYTALDTLTVEWKGIPGYLPLDYNELFWLPLPKHAWSIYTAKDLLQVEDSNRRPLGWGPYVIEEWAAGDHITLHKNPAYFRAGEGLPRYDTLVFRFLNSPASGYLEALQVGECDIVDRTAGLDEVVQRVREQEIAGSLRMYIGQGPDWEQVAIGIKPSSYDNGFSLYQGDRPDLFSDERMRQALVYCMDRQEIIRKFLYNMSSIPVTYLLPDHPLFLKGLEILPYDAAKGASLLDEIGWKDSDGDPATPRQAKGVPNVEDGTPLVIQFATTEAPLRKEVAGLLAESTAACGMRLEVQYYTPGQIYAMGPDGILFGRKFDLVQLAWKGGLEPPCELYLSEQIPTQENNWLGVNVAGYSSAAFDTACQRASLAKSGQEEAYRLAHQEAQRIFNEEIPAIPLYFRLKVIASRPDMCGLTIDVSGRSDLWNLERLDNAESCINQSQGNE